MSIEKVQRAIAAIRAGRMVILVDDEDRENEGDLVCAAEKITPEMINFMATAGRGLICLPMAATQLERLQLPMMLGPWFLGLLPFFSPMLCLMPVIFSHIIIRSICRACK